MKKAIALVLAMVMLLSLCSCKGEKKQVQIVPVPPGSLVPAQSGDSDASPNDASEADGAEGTGIASGTDAEPQLDTYNPENNGDEEGREIVSIDESIPNYKLAYLMEGTTPYHVEEETNNSKFYLYVVDVGAYNKIDDWAATDGDGNKIEVTVLGRGLSTADEIIRDNQYNLETVYILAALNVENITDPEDIVFSGVYYPSSDNDDKWGATVNDIRCNVKAEDFNLEQKVVHLNNLTTWYGMPVMLVENTGGTCYSAGEKESFSLLAPGSSLEEAKEHLEGTPKETSIRLVDSNGNEISLPQGTEAFFEGYHIEENPYELSTRVGEFSDRKWCGWYTINGSYGIRTKDGSEMSEDTRDKANDILLNSWPELNGRLFCCQYLDVLE